MSNREYSRRFRRIVSSMNRLIGDMQKDHPKASLYLANSTLCLMLDDSHDRQGNPQQHAILAQEHLKSSGGGDW